MSNKKIFIIIFLIAFSMRLAVLFSFAEEKSLLYINDSLTYLQTAKNIIYHGVYSMEISDTPHPDNFRTPLYPVFLIPFVWLKTSLYIPAIAQIIIISFGCGLIYLLGKKIFNERVATLAAFLFALEPFGALISAQIMVEAIFTPLFLVSILSLLIYIKNAESKYLWFGSLLLSFSALARPIALPLAVFLPFAVWLTGGQRHARIKRALLSLGIFLVILSPWLYYVLFTLKTTDFSAIVWTQGYEYRARYFDEWRVKRSAPATDRLPFVDMKAVNETLDARAIAPIKVVVRSYLNTHLGEYIVFHLLRMPYLFTDSGYTSIFNGLAKLNFNYDTTHGTVSDGYLEQISWRNLPATINQIKNQPLFLALLIADLIFVIIALLALSNLLIRWRLGMRPPKEIIFLILIILTYTFVASPIGNPRFRIPINPLLFLLAIDTILLIKRKHKIEYDNSK